jgi:YggT family protein
LTVLLLVRYKLMQLQAVTPAYVVEEVLSTLIQAVAQLFDLLIQLYIFIVIGRALISWVNPDPYNPIVRFLHTATEPVFRRMRRVLPLVFSGIDLTPIALLLLLTFLQRLISGWLFQLAHSLG